MKLRTEQEQFISEKKAKEEAVKLADEAQRRQADLDRFPSKDEIASAKDEINKIRDRPVETATSRAVADSPKDSLIPDSNEDHKRNLE